MRLPSSAHTSPPWRIDELTSDFRLDDVWTLPSPGEAGYTRGALYHQFKNNDNLVLAVLDSVDETWREERSAR